MAIKPKLGTGARFKALESALKNKKVGTTARGRKMAKALPGKTEPIHDPAALAAFIGRKKYGNAGFQALSANGRKNS